VLPLHHRPVYVVLMPCGGRGVT